MLSSGVWHQVDNCYHLTCLLLSNDDGVMFFCPGMFMSYSMHSQCELLMIGEKDFERVLLSSALDDLRKRFE